MSTGHPVHDKPPDVQHCGMVVDVQEGDLMVVFAQDEKESIHKFDELGEVVPPQHMNNLHRRR